MSLVRALAASVLLLYLSGCATPANQSGMTIDARPVESKRVPPQLSQQIAVKDVVGGQETNPMWRSNIGSSEFEQALEASLRNIGLAANGRQAGRYLISATLQRVDQPFMGLNLTVTTTINYDVIERSTNKSVWTRTITQSHTATLSDAFMAADRMRLANEGSAKANIRAFVEDLLETFKAP
jgi:hypothetical protein